MVQNLTILVMVSLLLKYDPPQIAFCHLESLLHWDNLLFTLLLLIPEFIWESIIILLLFGQSLQLSLNMGICLLLFLKFHNLIDLFFS